MGTRQQHGTSAAGTVGGTGKQTLKSSSNTGVVVSQVSHATVASKTAHNHGDADGDGNGNGNGDADGNGDGNGDGDGDAASRTFSRPSKNNRHDTFSDVKLFLEREYPDRQHTIEVVCSSARRDMDRCAIHVPFKLFCKTLQLFPEYNTCSSVATTKPEWPTHTSIACWHDCHTFATIPIPIPKTMRNPGNDSSNVYTVYGVFCSANCAVAYILDRNTYDQQQLIMLFKQMAVNVFNLPSTEVFAFQPAPPRIFLTLFGGHLSVDEFRRSSLTARNTLLTPPFISYSMVLEENARASQARASELTHALLVRPPPPAPDYKADQTLPSTGVGAASAFGDTPGGGCTSQRVTTTGNAPGVETFLDAAPISTHTIRGLRRPVTDAQSSSNGSQGDASGNTNTYTLENNRSEPKHETLFDTFIKHRNQPATRSTGDRVDRMMVEGEAQGLGLPLSKNTELPVVSTSFCSTDEYSDGADFHLHAKTGTYDQHVTDGKLEKAKQGRPPCASRAGVSTKKVERRIPKNTVSKSESNSNGNNGTSAFPAGDRLGAFQAGGTLAAFLKPYSSS